MTLSHLRGKWEPSHLEQKRNHKPFVDTGNAPRMKGDRCDGDGVFVVEVSLNRVTFGSRADYLRVQMAGKQNESAYAVKYYNRFLLQMLY